MEIYTAPLLGHPLSQETLRRLNGTLAFADALCGFVPSLSDGAISYLLNSGTDAEATSEKPVIMDANASVVGTSMQDAYLHVEMIYRNATCTPITLSCVLPGSNASGGVNKDFVSLLKPNESRIIREFFNRMANTLQFCGNGLSIEESKRDVA